MLQKEGEYKNAFILIRSALENKAGSES